MSQAPTAIPRPRSPNGSSDEPRVVDSESSIQDVLDALNDPDCRSILEVTTDSALTASELSEECDLALSTAYRKIDMLAETGLLEERTRIRSSGAHTSEYARAVEDIVVSVDSGTKLQIS